MLNQARIWMSFMMLFLMVFSVQAQNIEQVISDAKSYKDKLKADFFKLNGGINAMMMYNYIDGIEARRDPFSYRVGGNVTLSVLGWKVPASVFFSNGRTIYNYSLPSFKLPSYFLAGFKPSYKWAQLHVGNSSMTFSPYTLAGHSFQGGGVELNPGRFTFKSMYGRLRRSVVADLNSLQNIEPAYKRLGWGVMAGYETTKGESIKIILFKGWDDPNSIPTPDTSSNLTPKENTVISVIGKKNLGSKVSLQVDYAMSALTMNALSPLVDDHSNILQTIGGLFSPKLSTGYHNAIKTALQYKTKFGAISLNHEWVDPGYQTLGALFFNNDFENWTIASSASMKEGKIMLSGTIGLQRNNLLDNQINANRRLIGALNANLILSEQLNLNASYSNFAVTNRLRAITFPVTLVDSIILSQVNTSANVGLSRVAGSEKNITTVLTAAYQQANSIENDEVLADQSSRNYMANLMHNHTFITSKMTVSASFMFNRNENALSAINSFAPTIAAARPLMNDKLQLRASISYIAISSNTAMTNNMFSAQLGARFIPINKHSINFSGTLVNRKATNALGALPAFTESNIQLNYAWTF